MCTSEMCLYFTDFHLLLRIMFVLIMLMIWFILFIMKSIWSLTKYFLNHLHLTYNLYCDWKAPRTSAALLLSCSVWLQLEPEFCNKIDPLSQITSDHSATRQYVLLMGPLNLSPLKVRLHPLSVWMDPKMKHIFTMVFVFHNYNHINAPMDPLALKVQRLVLKL